jgi:hypothetical protein
MRRSTFAIVIGLSGLLGGFWISACSVNTNGAAPAPNDAASEASVADSTADANERDVVVEPTVDAPTEATAPRDAGDAGDANAETCTPANCAGACCGNHCVSRDCQGCATGLLFCPYSTTVPNSNGECVASCSSCLALSADGGVACFSCSSGGSQGTCAAAIDQCPTDLASGACPCSLPDAATCPGNAQVCAGTDGGACIPCGQPGTQGLSCRGGAACAEATATCQM